MKKTWIRILSLLFVCCLLVLPLVSCGKSADNASPGNSDKGAASLTDGKLPADRKLVKRVTFNVYTETYDNFLIALNTRMTELGAYAEKETYYGQSGSKRATRYATLTIRVPVEHLDELLDTVARTSEVVYQEANVEDVTLTYATLTARAESVRAEVQALEEMLAGAATAGATVSEIADLKEKIFEAKQILNETEAQIAAYDSLVAYSTVYLSVTESENADVVSENAFVRIWAGIKTSVVNIGHGFVEFFVWFFGSLPYFLLIGAVVTGLVFLIRYLSRKNKNKKN